MLVSLLSRRSPKLIGSPRPCCWLSKLRSNAKSWLNWVLGVDMFLQVTFGWCSRRKSLPPQQVAARKLQNILSKLWPGPCSPFFYNSHDWLLWDTQILRVYASIILQVFHDIRHFTDNFSFGSPHALHTSIGIFLKIETVQVTSQVFSSHVMSCCCQYQGLQYCRKNLIILKEFLRFRCLGSPYASTHTRKCRNISSKYISLRKGISRSGKKIYRGWPSYKNEIIWLV